MQVAQMEETELQALMRITVNGFERMEQKFEIIDERLDGLETEVGEIKVTLKSFMHMLADHEERITTLEK